MRTTTLALWTVLLGCAPVPEETAEPEPEPFTLVVVPDVQYLTLSYPSILDGMLQWVADEADQRNIAYLLQEGDITHENSDLEWDNAVSSFSLLDSGPPFALCVGNHDIGDGGDTSLFNEHFPVSTWGEPGIYEPDRMDNHFLTFAAGGGQWLVLSLIYDPPDPVLIWADGVVVDHPDHRVIVLTHAYLGPSGTRTGIGERIWDGVARRHPNVTLVFNGHYTSGEASRLVSMGDQGNSVVQMFANYQTRPLGGTGLLRIVEVDPLAGRLSVMTWTPVFDGTLDDEGNQFVLDDVPLGPL
ncbi:MAG: metallophosphoesterase [Deltaproteobacteria bacterium]|nr:metallophosphoesterase [Deltaproteobacteria bacterium]MBW2258069.1 metallophosphoesterase [Deltaproteobacteria bacterium]